jgi:hypothetical protein
MSGRRHRRHLDNEGGSIVRAEEGDESIGELADDAAKAKKELRESTETGAKVQKEAQDSGKQH